MTLIQTKNNYIIFLPFHKTEVYICLSNEAHAMGDTQDPKTENSALCL